MIQLHWREELWRILGGRVIPPRLFTKGRYIGGADEVAGLHEQGKLRKLLEGYHLTSPVHAAGVAGVPMPGLWCALIAVACLGGESTP